MSRNFLVSFTVSSVVAFRSVVSSTLKPFVLHRALFLGFLPRILVLLGLRAMLLAHLSSQF